MKSEHCDVDSNNLESTRWGASDRRWTTGNYGLETSPRLEWHFVKDMTWDGKKVTDTVGGFQKEGRNFTSAENMDVRRKAVSIESLHAEAPMLIHAMLVGIVEKKTRSALIRIIEQAKTKVPEVVALSAHQLAAFPKAKLQELAQKAGASDADIQDALGNDQFFADGDGDGQRDMNDMHTPAEISELYTKLDVNTAELLGLRLYTGPMFEFYNNVLRAKGGKVPFGGWYPGKAGEVTTGTFVTTIVSNRKHEARISFVALACCAGATMTLTWDNLEPPPPPTFNLRGGRGAIQPKCSL